MTSLHSFGTDARFLAFTPYDHAMMNAEDALDAALVRIAPLSPEYGGELSDHSPMVVEALARLGAPDAIDAYVAAVVPKRRPLSEERAEQLSRFGALAAEATSDVDHLGAAGALELWLPRLLEGFSGAAFHGSIRVGHALRALSSRDTKARLAELGRALAYTTLRSEPLPAPRPGGRPIALADALSTIRPASAAMSARSAGLTFFRAGMTPALASLGSAGSRAMPPLISTALAERAGGHPDLADFAGALVEPADPKVGLRELRDASVDLYLRGEYLPQATFTLLHGVTGMDAAAAIGAQLEPAGALALWRAAAHALLALRVSFIGEVGARPVPAARASLDAAVAVSIRSLDDHAIKLAAALVEATTSVPEPTRAAALERWAGRFA